MGVGTTGDDVLVGGNGNELHDGLAGNDTATYATADRGVVANLGTGIAAYIPRIMPVGDSITYGAPLASTSGGYRGPLWDQLVAANLPIDFVGSSAHGKFEDIDHEGHGGWTINEIAGSIDGWLTAAKPDVVLLIIGTNDTNIGSPTPADIAARLSNLIDDIASRPDPPTIFIGPIPPMVAQPADRVALAQGYNALIPDLIAQKRAEGVDITFVPMSDLTGADMTAPPADGGLHPNASGYQKIADHWFDALLTLGTDNGAFSNTPRDSFASIENLEGSPFKDVLTGDAGPNKLTGLAGHDILDGAAGADTMTGGVGNDSYVVDNGSDQVVELTGEGTDTVRTSLSAYTLGANLENVAFTGTSGFAGVGNGLANVMRGGSGDDTLDGGGLKDTLVGGAGADRLIGGGDADRMEGGTGDDFFSVNSSGDDVVETLSQADGGGIDTVESGQAYTLGANVENLVLIGTSNIAGVGNGLANVITGNARNNALDGQGGDDTLIGGAGTDTLTGGAGGDVFQGASAADLNGDRINDYAAGERIILQQNLVSAANVTLETSGSNKLLKIDGDNNGSFETTLTLQGPVSGQLLVSSGSGLSNNVIQLVSSGVSIAATSAAKAEGNAGATNFTFTITRVGDLSNAMTVDWAVTGSGASAANAADFGGALPSGQASFAAGEGSKLVQVSVSGDTATEADEGFTVILSNPSDATTISQGTALGSIQNDDVAPSMAVAATDASKPEGDGGLTAFTFTITRSGDLANAVTVDWAVTGSGASAADAADFSGALPNGQASFSGGEVSKIITVEVSGDALVEANEGFTFTLSNPSDTTTFTQATASGSIQNDDVAPAIAIVATDASKPEGNGGLTAYTFTITRSGDLTNAMTVDWAVSGSGSNPSDAADFGGALPNGQASFSGGEGSKIITIEVSGDTLVEVDEGFTITLSNPSDTTIITQAAALGSVQNDDVAPTVGIAATDASKPEGDSGLTDYSFTITRSGDLSNAMTVDWAVTGSGANPSDAADFGGILPGGQASFAAGEGSKLVHVSVAGDTLVEADEGFSVTLSNPSDATTISQATALGSIQNDDVARTLSIAATQASKPEGNSGLTAYTFTITRTGDLTNAVTVDWAVSGSGASAADAADFSGALPNGQASFSGGEGSKVITVEVSGDTLVEANEGFTVTLSNPSDTTIISQATALGSIQNDDVAPTLSIAATSANKPEGNSGLTAYTFTITRTGDLTSELTVDWAVTGSGVSAADAADFGGALPTGQASFAGGEGSKTITVQVSGDALLESNEGFTVTLSNPSAPVTLAQATANGSIQNDDTDQPPAPETPDLVAVSDTGISATDNLTNDTTPTFTGIAAAGSTVRLLEGSKVLGQVIADSGGAWTITSSALSAGSHVISATATSPAGTVSPRSGLATVVVDTSPPSKASTPDLLAESDTGRSNSDNITGDATPTLKGSAQAGSIITIFEGSTVVGTGVADSSGKWAVTTSGLSDGAHSLAAEAADAAGNVAAPSSLLKLTVDTQATVPEITSATMTKLMGVAEPGALVFITEGPTQLGKVTATSSGTWTFSKSFSNAPHTITVSSEDKAGNIAAGPGQTLLGSSGANSLTGGPGDDRIVGLGGADTLAGGAGDDVFVFGTGFGADVVNGFVAGAASGDSIELSRAMLGLSSGASAQTAFDAVMMRTQDLPDRAVISIDGQNSITLVGVTKASLELSDFVFI